MTPIGTTFAITLMPQGGKSHLGMWKLLAELDVSATG